MIVSGDFSRLAEDYAKYRPGYSSAIAKAIIGLVDHSGPHISAADIGAGTGIWTRILQEEGVRSLVAIEPNDEMRFQGEAQSDGIIWKKGTAEQTGLANSCVNLVSMASAFHWTSAEDAFKEFHRILRKNGLIALLWNPRETEKSPEETKVQELLEKTYKIGPRVSSGRQGITRELTNILNNYPLWQDVIYCEAEHSRTITAEQYIGTWRSVNDIRNQLGEERFADFIVRIQSIISNNITVHYLTRAWVARAR